MPVITEDGKNLANIDDAAELMRTCAPLYPSFALESAASLALFFFFSYLSILISSKQQLKAPGAAICKFCWTNLKEWFWDTHRVLKRWPHMHEMDMGQRFRYCRRLNATICRFSACFALISVTRWLHINNVNGFRYLSYAVTCPLMQAELVLLIAPVVPCYRIVTVLTALVTAVMLVSGYIAGQYKGPLWTGDLHELVFEQNFDNLTQKGWQASYSMVILSFLSFVQIPVLCMLFFCGGGSRHGKLPHGYPTLLAITSITWLGFPIWWMLSYEGMSVITDTRANGFGFVCLNGISKGGFTLQMLSMVKYFKRHHAPAPAPGAAQSGASRPRSGSVATLPDFNDNKEEKRVSAPPPPPLARSSPNEPQQHQRQNRTLPTGQSLNWFVAHMKNWETNSSGEVPAHQVPSQKKEGDPQVKIIYDVVELTDKQLMSELTKRLSAADSKTDKAKASKVGLREQDLKEKALQQEIARACSVYAADEDSD